MSITKSVLNKILTLSVASAVFISFLSGCSAVGTGRHPEPITRSGLYFDTLISISIYDSDDTTLLDSCFDICQKYEDMLSSTVSGSDVDNINSSAGNKTEVSSETAKLISDSLYYSDITDGMYDITIYPVSRLWDFHSQTGTPPKDEPVRDALLHVGYGNITLENNETVQLKDPDASIDLGSIAKGFIADELSGYLRSQNVTSAIIDMGGDMNIIGEKDKNTPFTIGIKDPDAPGSIMAGVNISDMCIATSGTYERYFEYNGKRYHHILDPHTGYPVDTDITSVSVITDSSERADALCTCSILLGSQKALELIESQKNTEAYIKLTNGEILKSSGAGKYLK